MSKDTLLTKEVLERRFEDLLSGVEERAERIELLANESYVLGEEAECYLIDHIYLSEEILALRMLISYYEAEERDEKEQTQGIVPTD